MKIPSRKLLSNIFTKLMAADSKISQILGKLIASNGQLSVASPILNALASVEKVLKHQMNGSYDENTT